MAEKSEALKVQGVLREIEGGLVADLTLPECTEISVKVVLDKVQGRVVADLTAPECTELHIERPHGLEGHGVKASA